MIGLILAIITFPGVIVHEMAHLFFCRLFGVHVEKVCYFRLGNPCGYVLHDAPSSALQQLFIGIGPFFINTALGILLCAPIMLQPHPSTDSWQSKLLLWLGISVAMHAFPSTGDARSIWQVTWSRRTPWYAKLLLSPIIALIYLLALGSIVWLDLVYAGLITCVLPHWLRYR